MYADMSSKTLFGAKLRATLIGASTWMEQPFDASVAKTIR